jgi:ankyrin repeat protein
VKVLESSSSKQHLMAPFGMLHASVYPFPIAALFLKSALSCPFCFSDTENKTCVIQVRLLVEEGGADVNVRDRWGNSPLDEAQRVAARPCAAYFEQRLARPANDNAGRRTHALTPLEENRRR